MKDFFFIEDEDDTEDEPAVMQQSFWPFPVVNSERSPESQSLINKGH